MSESDSPPHTITKADILGCWRLDRAIEERGGVLGPNRNFGSNPKGLLHYLAGDRVSVAIAAGGRKLMTGRTRRTAPAEELAESARTFDAYAGRFSLLAPDKIAHHIEIGSHQNYVGADLVRGIVVDGDLLTLHVPIAEEDGVIVRYWLEWRRLA